MRKAEPKTPMGKRIRQRRKELKLTQEKLGKRINVSAGTISRWEFDGYEPELTLAVCLADALRVSLDWLVSGRITFTAPCVVGDKVYEVIEDGRQYYITELEEVIMSNRQDRRAEARERANRYRRAMAAWYEQEPPRWRLIAWIRWRARMPR